jgi:outer membrane protein assembly factor BamB
MIRFLLVLLGILLIVESSLLAQVTSQWRGPNRDGKYPNEKLQKKWPAGGPELLWSQEGFKEGFSSPAVTSKSIYLTGMEDGQGYLFALNLNGKQQWVNNYGSEWDDGHPGSRGTVTVIDDKIYLISGDGVVYCFQASDGKTLWTIDMVDKFGARNLRWGITESPLIDGDRLYCTPGGPEAMMVILDRHTGKTIKIIKGNGDRSAYCSPCLIQFGKRRLILTMTQQSLIAVDADADEYLWGYSHITRYDINPNTPLYDEGYVYSFSGYGTGGQLFEMKNNADGADRIWADETLDSQMGTAILHV